MSFVVYTHDDTLAHNPGPHKEMGPARIQLVRQALRSAVFAGLTWREAEPIARDVLALIHTPEYIERVLAPIADGQEVAFDFETYAVEGTARAVLRSAGLVWQAVQDVIKGEATKAFCLVSPGGHHAEADMALGYCFFNHVALAGIAAQKLLGVSRVAVLDFDAHHGNGTQSFFWNNADLLYVSLHEDNPLSGFANEHGSLDNIMNVPLPYGADGDLLLAAMEERALPKIAAFKPDLLLLSAGFDMHADDPLGRLSLENEAYARLGERLSRFAKEVCGGKFVAVMEGGYNLDVLGSSVACFVKGILDHDKE